jgi:hypothetical protein
VSLISRRLSLSRQTKPSERSSRIGAGSRFARATTTGKQKTDGEDLANHRRGRCRCAVVAIGSKHRFTYQSHHGPRHRWRRRKSEPRRHRTRTWPRTCGCSGESRRYLGQVDAGALRSSKGCRDHSPLDFKALPARGRPDVRYCVGDHLVDPGVASRMSGSHAPDGRYRCICEHSQTFR